MGLFALELDSGGSELEEISLELDEDLAVLELLDGLFSLLEDDGSVDDELLMKKKMSVLFEWKKVLEELLLEDDSSMITMSVSLEELFSSCAPVTSLLHAATIPPINAMT